MTFCSFDLVLNLFLGRFSRYSCILYGFSGVLVVCVLRRGSHGFLFFLSGCEASGNDSCTFASVR